jgi:hypothetical protein
MSRLIAFGCSNTYGQGLEDCQIGPNPNPSKLAWPNLLGDLLNLEVINNGIPGASNLEILYQILNFEFQKNDIVVILWTFYYRDLFFTDTNQHYQIGSWNTTESFTKWLEIHSEIDLKIKSLLHIHHAENYLENRKIQNYSFLLDLNLIKEGIPNYLKLKNLILSAEITQVDNALDHYHLGPISHKKYALSFYKEIQKNHD